MRDDDTFRRAGRSRTARPCYSRTCNVEDAKDARVHDASNVFRLGRDRFARVGFAQFSKLLNRIDLQVLPCRLNLRFEALVGELALVDDDADSWAVADRACDGGKQIGVGVHAYYLGFVEGMFELFMSPELISDLAELQ